MVRTSALLFFCLMHVGCVSGDIRHDCTISVLDKQIHLQVVRSEKERSRGLMYKKDIADNEGMLFVFEGEEERSFWMKNTFLHLDMLFLDRNGVVKKILKNVPPLTESPRKSQYPAMYVVELKGGMSDAFRIKEGDSLPLTSCL